MAGRPAQAISVTSLEFSTADLAKAESALSGIANGLPRATAGASNKTLAKAKTVFLRGMTQYLTIRRTNLVKRVYVRKASPNNGDPAYLKVMGRPIGLVNFAVRDTRQKGAKGAGRGTGVRGEVIRGKPLSANEMFIATGQFDNRHVFQRVGSRRLPIEAAYRSLFLLFTRGPVKAQLESFVAAEMPKQFDSQIDRLLHIRKP